MATFSEAPAANKDAGAKIFKMKCAQCHTVEQGAGHKQGVGKMNTMEVEVATATATATAAAAAATSIATSSVSSLPPKPEFPAMKPNELFDGQVQFTKVDVPRHRYTPLKKAWLDIYNPIYEQMKIDVMMNLKSRKVELKTRPDTPDVSNLKKCADFVTAFMLGFDITDAVALLRVDDLYVDFLYIKEVKTTLKGDHMSRAIGRLSGKGGKTKFAIENATRTRIVIAGDKISILGSSTNIKLARHSLCSLIIGSPAGKVYSKLRAVSARLAERV